MTIGERIKQIRKSNGLTLEKFGEKIRITAQSVSKLEKGFNNPSDQTVSLICREFGVSERWLLTGDGPAKEPPPEDYLAALAREYEIGQEGERFLRLFMTLDPPMRNLTLAYLVRVGRELRGEPPEEEETPSREQEAEQSAPQDAPPSKEAEAADLAAKVYAETLQGGEKASESGPPEAGVGIA